MMTPRATELARNRILAGLPATELQVLADTASPVALRPGDRLYGADADVEALTFLFAGAVSLVLVGPTGQTVEVMSIGTEGPIGLEAYLGDGRSSWEAIVQGAGGAVTLPFAWLRANGDLLVVFGARLQRYGAALIHIAAQGAFCASQHSDASRTATWLLDMRTVPNAGGDLPSIDLLALMLGFDLEQTQAAIARLDESVEAPDERGQVVVRDAVRLALAACVCSGDKRAVLDRLLGPTP